MRAGQLMPRDLEILRFLTRFGVATAEQVHREVFGEQRVRNAYRRLEVLASHRLVNHQRVFWRKPGVWWATQSGTRASGVELKPYKLNKPLLEHTLELVNLYQEIGFGGEEYLRWRTERELRREMITRPIPDAMAMFVPRQWTSIELELSNKRSVRYRELLEGYAENEHLSNVRFYFSSGPAMRRVERIAWEIGEEYRLPIDYFQFFEYEPEGFFSDAPRRSAPGDRIRSTQQDGVPF